MTFAATDDNSDLLSESYPGAHGVRVSIQRQAEDIEARSKVRCGTESPANGLRPSAPHCPIEANREAEGG
jgi:hypothetical protein